MDRMLKKAYDIEIPKEEIAKCVIKRESDQPKPLFPLEHKWFFRNAENTTPFFEQIESWIIENPSYVIKSHLGYRLTDKPYTDYWEEWYVIVYIDEDKDYEKMEWIELFSKED